MDLIRVKPLLITVNERWELETVLVPDECVFLFFFLFFFSFLGVEGMYPLNEILCGWLFLKGFICGQKYCDFDGIMTEICVAH